MNVSISLDQTAFVFGNRALTYGDVALAASIIFAFLLLFLVLVAWRNGKAQRAQMLLTQERAAQAEARVADILSAQSEMQGRLSTIADIFGSRQSELNTSLSQRLDAMTSRIGQTMTDQQKATHENLAKLQERLAVSDTAQNNIQQLAGQVVELQTILSNKQTRGAFGQSGMELFQCIR